MATPGGRSLSFGQVTGVSDDLESARTATPIVEERLVLGTRTVETDRVRVRTIVEDRPETLSGTSERGVVDIERVPMFREVLQPPAPRQEGDTIIVSVVEERLVKRSFLVEEVRISRRSVTEAVELSASVRVMHAEIEHLPTNPEQGHESDG